MRKRSWLVFFLGILMVSFSCKKEKENALPCDQLKEGLFTNNEAMVKEAMNAILLPLRAQPTSTDPFGQRTNLENLAQRLNSSCAITATLPCYNCIKTNPPQTEIFLSFSYGGALFRKVVDVSYTLNNRLIYVGMHD